MMLKQPVSDEEQREFDSIDQRIKAMGDSWKKQKDAIAAFLSQGLEPGQLWFFWCLKGQRFNEYTKEPDGWEWPPRLSGRIAAKDKQEVRQKIAEEFGEEYPMRVLKKDYVKYPFLLYIEPMVAGGTGERYALRFMPATCKECGVSFTLNDKYNDPHANSSRDTCSSECEHRLKQRERAEGFEYQGGGTSPPVIYAITHKPSGQRYIGKTEQPFTLRWYQHMFHPGTSAFHGKVRVTPITEWQFEVIEHLGYLSALHNGSKNAAYRNAISEREQFWINHFNTLSDGLNSVKAASSLPEPETADEVKTEEKDH